MIRQEASASHQLGLPVICCICGQLIDISQRVTIEHVTPISAGGSNRRDNLGPAHTRCNFGKH